MFKKKGFVVLLATFLLLVLTSCVKNIYTVNFYDVDEKLIHTEKVTSGDLVNEFIAPEIENHEFIGWFVQDKKFDFNLPIIIDLDLYSKYESLERTVTFLVDDELYLEETFLKNDFINKPIDPVKSGYVFVEWQLNGERFDFNERVTEDTILAAKFISENEAIYYKVSYGTYLNVNFNSGSDVLKGQEVVVTIDLPSNFVFDKLLINGEVVNVTNLVYKFNITKDVNIEVLYKELEEDNFTNMTLSDYNLFLKNVDLRFFKNDNYNFDIRHESNNYTTNMSGRISLDNNLELSKGYLDIYENNFKEGMFVYEDGFLYILFDKYEEENRKVETVFDKYALSLLFSSSYLGDLSNLNNIIEFIFNEYINSLTIEELPIENDLISFKKQGNIHRLKIDINNKDKYNNTLKLPFILQTLFDNVHQNTLIEVYFKDYKIDSIKLDLGETKEDKTEINVSYSSSYELPSYNKNINQEESVEVTFNYLGMEETNLYFKEFILEMVYYNSNHFIDGYRFQGSFIDENYEIHLEREHLQSNDNKITIYLKYEKILTLDDIKDLYLNEDILYLRDFNQDVYYAESNEYIALIGYDYFYLKDKINNKVYFAFENDENEINSILIDNDIKSIKEVLAILTTFNTTNIMEYYVSSINGILVNEDYLFIAELFSNLNLMLPYSMFEPIFDEEIDLSDFNELASLIIDSLVEVHYTGAEILFEHKYYDINTIEEELVIGVYKNNSYDAIYKTVSELKELGIVTSFEYNLEENNVEISYIFDSSLSYNLNLFDSTKGKIVINELTLEYEYLNEMRNFFIAEEKLLHEIIGWKVDNKIIVSSIDELKAYQTSDKYILVKPVYSFVTYDLFVQYLKNINNFRLEGRISNDSYMYYYYYDIENDQLFSSSYEIIYKNINGNILEQGINYNFTYEENTIFNENNNEKINNIKELFTLLDYFLDESLVYENIYSYGNYASFRVGDYQFNVDVYSNEIHVNIYHGEYDTNISLRYYEGMSFEIPEVSYNKTINFKNNVNDENVYLTYNSNKLDLNQAYSKVFEQLIIKGKYIEGIYEYNNGEINFENKIYHFENGNTYYIKYLNSVVLEDVLSFYNSDKYAVNLYNYHYYNILVHYNFVDKYAYYIYDDMIYYLKMFEDDNYEFYLIKNDKLYSIRYEHYLHSSLNYLSYLLNASDFDFYENNSDYYYGDLRISKHTGDLYYMSSKIVKDSDLYRDFDISNYEVEVDEIINIEVNYSSKFTHTGENYLTLYFESGIVYNEYINIELLDINTITFEYNGITYNFPNNLNTYFYDHKFGSVYIFDNQELYYYDHLINLNSLPTPNMKSNLVTFENWQLYENEITSIEELINKTSSVNSVYHLDVKTSLKPYRDNIEYIKSTGMIYLGNHAEVYYDFNEEIFVNSGYIIKIEDNYVYFYNEDGYTKYHFEDLIYFVDSYSYRRILLMKVFLEVMDLDFEIEENLYVNDNYVIEVYLNRSSFYLELRLDGQYISFEQNLYNYDNYIKEEYNYNYLVNVNVEKSLETEIFVSYNTYSLDLSSLINNNYFNHYYGGLYLDQDYLIETTLAEEGNDDNYIKDTLNIVYLNFIKAKFYEELIEKYFLDKYVLESRQYNVYVNRNNYIYIESKFQFYYSYYYDLLTNTVYEKSYDSNWKISNESINIVYEFVDTNEYKKSYNNEYYYVYGDYYNFKVYQNGLIYFTLLKNSFSTEYEYVLKDFDFSKEDLGIVS